MSPVSPKKLDDLCEGGMFWRCALGARSGSTVFDPVCTPLAPRRIAFCALNPSGRKLDGNHDGFRKLRRPFNNFLGLEW